MQFVYMMLQPRGHLHSSRSYTTAAGSSQAWHMKRAEAAELLLQKTSLDTSDSILAENACINNHTRPRLALGCQTRPLANNGQLGLRTLKGKSGKASWMRSSLHSGHSTLKLNSNSQGAECHLEGRGVQENELLILTVAQTCARSLSKGAEHRPRTPLTDYKTCTLRNCIAAIKDPSPW